MYWKTKWFSTSLGCTILLITQCAINSLASRNKCYPVEIMFIREAHPWLCSVGFLAGFFQCKILLETRILRVKTLTGPGEQFLKCRGRWPPTLRWGGGRSIFLLFPLCGCLELSDYWTFFESLLSRVLFINFKLLKSTFLLLCVIAHAGSTTRSLQIMILHSRFL